MVYATSTNPGYDIFGRLRAGLETLTIAVERRAAYKQTCRALGNLSDRELEDIGVRRADIRAIAASAH